MTKTGLSDWRAAHSITYCRRGQRQSRAESHHLVAEPCHRICVRDAGECLAGSIIKVMVESMQLSWQQGPLSMGTIGRFLVPEPLPKSPRRLREKHFRSLSKWSGTWRDCCR